MTDRPPFQPQVFGHYYLLEHIAYGGMAEIYRAKSFGASGFERELVLKRVLEKLIENPDFLRMLVNEAKLTATLQHGNIAQVFELGLEKGVYFMTMEYVEGVSLKALLRRVSKAGERLTPQIGAYLILQIARGLHYAHEKSDPMGKPLGIVHCDISPENIVVGYDGNVKIVDFGIARAQSAFSNYKEGMVMGKFNYVAPEQAMGRPLDRRADIFSTGILLYEALTGQHPFGRKGDVDTLVRIARFQKGEVVPPEQAAPGLPKELSEICMTAMAHDLQERYATAQNLAEALGGYLRAIPTALLHDQLKDLLHDRFAQDIATRRSAREQDPRIIGELQRKRAVMVDDSGEFGALAAKEPVAEPPEKGKGKGALLGGIGLVLGLALGLGGALAMRPPPASVLFVTSDPAGATVKLEGSARGETPVAVELEEGTPYLLQLDLANHEPWQETFTAEGALVEKSATLKAKTARLEVVSQPEGARVQIDGEDRGVTPVSLELPIGTEHVVRISRGTVTEERRVNLSGAGTRLQVEFSAAGKPAPGKSPPKRRKRGR
ncbi:MAG: serine/threonine protein kinase [Deltaproteobacteria bacterium]|nr:serine/threonine protein kinase [Deltaproteobacteria bacterium]